MGLSDSSVLRTATRCILAIATLGLRGVSPACAQPPPEARLIVTVVDQTGGRIRAAMITVSAVDGTAAARQTLTTESGVATVSDLVPGIYSIRAEFAGFKPRTLPDVRLGPGDNRRAAVLELLEHAETVLVQRDPQVDSSSREGSFLSSLTTAQIEALSDDPDEMRRQLLDIAGPGASIRVDTFEGQPLPPKALIKAIHITRDAFAAENHTAGATFVDIITQPGRGPLRATARTAAYSSSFLGGRNPFTGSIEPGRSIGGGATLSGSLAKDVASFSLGFSAETNSTAPSLYALTPAGLRAESAALRARTDGFSVYGQLDYSFTKNQTLRLAYSRMTSHARNLGVGAYDLPERAYGTETRRSALRLQEAGPLWRRFFINTRFSADWATTRLTSVVDAPTVVVVDAFTSGGAQRAGASQAHMLAIASDVDYIRGMHSWRAGARIDAGHFSSDERANYLGTYVFESLASYQALSPSSYSRRIGPSSVDYWDLQAGFYLQDDVRINNRLTISPGVRMELQNHVAGRFNGGPRVGVTWSPRRDGRTTIRGSTGVFYDWLSSLTYEQTLRVDGTHQQEVTVEDPSYPVTSTPGLPPTSRYLLSPETPLARTLRVSAAVEHQLTKSIRATALYTWLRNGDLLVGRNLNPPVDGTRPDPSVANIIEAVPLAAGRTNSLLLTANINLGTAASGAPKTLAWRRGLALMVSYQLASTKNNTDGAFFVPATVAGVSGDWGPVASDVRNRLYASVTSGAFRNFNISANFTASSGTPYTVWSGRDLNGDSIFNDRQYGTLRNTARSAPRFDSYAYVSYAIAFGGKQVALPPGVSITSAGGVVATTSTTARQAGRYRLTLALAVNNLTNHANKVGYSGAMTSPFFMQPTGVQGLRQLRVQASVTF
jgi:hypothetical protein